MKCKWDYFGTIQSDITCVRGPFWTVHGRKGEVSPGDGPSLSCAASVPGGVFSLTAVHWWPTLVRAAAESFITLNTPLSLPPLALSSFFLSLLSFGGQPLHPGPTPNSLLSGDKTSIRPGSCDSAREVGCPHRLLLFMNRRNTVLPFVCSFCLFWAVREGCRPGAWLWRGGRRGVLFSADWAVRKSPE